jgi:hypothetical protein
LTESQEETKSSLMSQVKAVKDGRDWLVSFPVDCPEEIIQVRVTPQQLDAIFSDAIQQEDIVLADLVVDAEEGNVLALGKIAERIWEEKNS